MVSLWFSLRTSNFKGYSVESLTGTLQGLKRLSKPLQVVPRGGQEIGRLEGFCLTGFSPAIDLQWRVSFSLGFLDSARCLVPGSNSFPDGGAVTGTYSAIRGKDGTSDIGAWTSSTFRGNQAILHLLVTVS